MRRKLKDQLMRLSFGELTPEEAGVVQREAAGDPESRQMMRDCQSMRSDLGLLKNIPPDQLSTERLKQAILAKGLEPAPSTGSSFGWVWMPVTVALIAFSMATWNGQGPRVPVGGNIEKRLPSASGSPIFIAPRLEAMNEASNVTTADSSSTFTITAVDAPEAVAIAHTGQSARRVEPPMPITDGSQIALVIPDREPLVMIASDSDDDTGAKKATEVDSANDVLISG